MYYICITSFNRNIMECKYRHYRTWKTNNKVLIETLWNVNQLAFCSSLPCHSVLIETLWNVNWGKVSTMIMMSERFNRNIMECKYRILKNLININNRFNRNIMECKYFSYEKLKQYACVLIETLWNVNVEQNHVYGFGQFVLIETLWNVNSDTRAA